MAQLEDQTTIVTGSSSGFGRKIATAFAGEGASVVCADVRREPREGGYDDEPDLPTDELIEQYDGEAAFTECDVTDPEEVTRAVSTAVDEYSSIDIMVNNAGIYPPIGMMHERPEEDLQSAFAVNAQGLWNGSKQSIKQFIEQGNGGNIINMVSTAGLYGWANQTAYNASKGAAKQITESLAIDYGPHDIRVNAICPGFAPTALTEDLYEQAEFQERVKDDTPLGDRWTSPEDVTSMALFLASDASEFLTGTFQVVDGGHSLRYAHTRGL